MRTIAALAMIAVVAGPACRSGGVEKSEEIVQFNPPPPKPFEARKKLAVLEFEDKSGYGKGRLGHAAADVLTTYLVESNQFQVVERQHMSKILEEQKFQQSGAVDQNSAIQVGKLLGVQYMAYGAVTNFGIRTEATNVILYQQKEQVAESQVDVRLINVETGVIMFAKHGRGKAHRAVRGAVGLGGRMSYDETLAGDSLRAAIVKMMDELVRAAP